MKFILFLCSPVLFSLPFPFGVLAPHSPSIPATSPPTPPTIFTLNLYLLPPTPSLRIRPSPSIPPSPFYLLVLKGS